MKWFRVILFGLCAFGLGWWLPIGEADAVGSEVVVTEQRIGVEIMQDEKAWWQQQWDRQHKEVEAAYQKAWERDVMAGVVLEP